MAWGAGGPSKACLATGGCATGSGRWGCPAAGHAKAWVGVGLGFQVAQGGFQLLLSFQPRAGPQNLKQAAQGLVLVADQFPLLVEQGPAPQEHIHNGVGSLHQLTLHQHVVQRLLPPAAGLQFLDLCPMLGLQTSQLPLEMFALSGEEIYGKMLTVELSMGIK